MTALAIDRFAPVSRGYYGCGSSTPVDSRLTQWMPSLTLFVRFAPYCNGSRMALQTALRGAAATVGMALAIVVVTACSSSSSSSPDSRTSSPGDDAVSPSTLSQPASSSSSPPADPRLAAAERAYLDFTQTSHYAEAHPPRRLGDPLPQGGNYRAHSFDPARNVIDNYIYFLTTSGLVMGGTPPRARPSLVRVALNASPYPSVYLSDCPTAPVDWRAVAVTPGPPPTQKTASGPPPPYRVSVQMIFYKNHWGAYKITTDKSRTCSP
jgi:hypothetical protein